jgi:predicted ribosome quality control (RQC) complex YloA/Tae2 family protein
VNYDAITTTAIRRELAETLTGGRVQHVHHPDDLSLALEIYAKPTTHWLYLSVEPDAARVHLLAERPARTTDRVTPLLLLLRKYVDGGRIESIEQPPLERVLRFRFSRRDPTGELWHTDLVAEIMGRLSNLILLDADGSVMDSIKRVPPSLNRVRTVLPRHRYDPPPPQDKLDPRTLAADALARALQLPASSLVDSLVTHVNACSPMLAREVIARTGGPAKGAAAEADPAALAETLRALWSSVESSASAPTVGVEDGRVVAFAPYEIRSLPHVEPIESSSAAVARFFSDRAARPRPASDEARRRAYRAALAEAQDRLRAKLYSLRQSLVGDEAVGRLRAEGEQLLAEQRVEEAQRAFERYAKAKTAARDVPAMIDGVEHELRYLDEALTLLDLAADPQEVAALRAEWAELGYLGGGGLGGTRAAKPARDRGTRYPGRRRPKTARPAGFRRLKVAGFDVLVGRSGRGNDVLLSREARPDDVWLHARGVPGAHVVVRSGGKEVPDTVLRRAAALAAGPSQARTAPSVGVDYTLCKYVDRVKGGPPGLANYRGERTLHVTPAPLLDYVTGR